MRNLLSKVLPTGKFWTDRWHLVSGCQECSPGCANCWFRAEAKVRQHHPHENVRRLHEGLLTETGSWNGTVRCNEHLLELPLRARKSRVYAIWSDLFHESVPFTFILKVLTIMALCPRHRFIIVTKRAQRCAGILAGEGGWPRSQWQRRLSQEAYTIYGDQAECQVHNTIEGACAPGYNLGWPLSNVTILVTMEDQLRADERAPHALQLAGMGWRVGALCEPLLGQVRLDRIHEVCKTLGGAHFERWESALNGRRPDFIGDGPDIEGFPRLSWLITGGESGHGARPAHPDWVRSLRDQAQAAGAPFMFKQWGEWEPVGPLYSGNRTDAEEDRWANEIGRREAINQHGHFCETGVQPKPGAFLVEKVGKKVAGRDLDGREWLEVPA